MTSTNELNSEELRRLATEIVDKLNTQERVELLEWAKKELPVITKE